MKKPKIFKTKVAGVTHKNSDGTERQKIIKKCKTGENLLLIREPNNPYDKSAISVHRESGEQIGYIASHVSKTEHEAIPGLADEIDKGRKITAKVFEIIGGFEFDKSYGCLIEITKH